MKQPTKKPTQPTYSLTAREVLENTLTVLKSAGYGPGGDVYDDLNLALCRLTSDTRPAAAVMGMKL